ncbi:hypothetical protein SLS60_009346 [Paraconiothyrium brasiliense]|uniref:Pantothenate transporter liz1 n=1 Tax=Paraconiothyrium brasiliense TaxID=300254 RepID=A0ABR3QU29_9PLEO
MAPTFIRNFRSFIWDSDTHLKSHEERKLLRKLDFSILTIGCLGFFLKYLDQGNLSNAYVSGMQEDLKMLGNEYTYAVTCYTVAYACMTVPVGFMTWFILPDTPYTTKSWFLSEEEKQLAIERVREAGKAAPVPLTIATFKVILTRWRWYAFVFGYVLYGSSCGASDYFGIWLKSEHFTVVDRNLIPTGSKLISGFCVVLWGFLSDYTGSRFALVLCPLIYGLIPNGILAFWPASQGVKMFAFMTTGVQLMTAIFYAWANEVCADNNEERAIVISSMNGFQYAVAAWLPIVIFPQTMAPTFRYGFPATWGLVIAALLAIIGIQVLHTREQRKKQHNESTVERGSSDDSGEETGEIENKAGNSNNDESKSI